ncbi:MAG: hypothetical protein HY291_22620 [Planctomycetes bacterium]|nr:hypothetical protein [Planctomycetota bacterium]
MPTKIKIQINEHVLFGELNESATAQALLKRLPLKVRMSRWGEEYYGSIGKDLGTSEASNARDLMKVGELAFWLPGNALCIFFGPTPASSGQEPRAASTVNPIGSLEGTYLDILRKLGGSIQATVEKA